MSDIQDIPAAQYHAGKGVSKSMLDRLAQSPAHLQAWMKAPREETDALTVGTLTHTAVLEPEKFGEGKSHWTKPDGMSFATKEGKAWKAEKQLGSSLPIITADTARSLDGMANAVRSHTIAVELLAKGKAEQSVYAIHPATGVEIRGRMDWITEDESGPLIVDLKTTEDARDFAKSVANYRYHVQAALYSDLLELSLGKKAVFVFIVVEKSAPHGIRIVTLDTNSLAAGRLDYERLLVVYKECVDSGEWPAYPVRVETVELPPWAFKTAMMPA